MKDRTPSDVHANREDVEMLDTDPSVAKPKEPEDAAPADVDPVDSENGDDRPSEEPGNSRDSEAPDPFDPARLRLSQDTASEIGVKKQLVAVPVKKPSKERWVRVHPSEEYRIQTAVLELKDEREVYLVLKIFRQKLRHEFFRRRLEDVQRASPALFFSFGALEREQLYRDGHGEHCALELGIVQDHAVEIAFCISVGEEASYLGNE